MKSEAAFYTYHSKLHKTRKFFVAFIIAFVFFSAAALLLPQFRDSLHNAVNLYNESTHPAAVESLVNGNVFADVPASHPQAEAIEYLKNHGIIEGYKDGNFYPDKELTRGEFAKLMVTAKGAMPHSIRYSYCFDDVSKEWFAPYVCFAKTKGWVHGMDEHTFAPEDKITAAQASSMLDNAFERTSDLHGSANDEPLTRAVASQMLADVLKKPY